MAAKGRVQIESRHWLHDPEIRNLNATARALLVDLMCIANDANPVGDIRDNLGRPLALETVAALCRLPTPTFDKAFRNLLDEGFVSERSADCYFLPGTVQQEKIRAARAAGGRMSQDHPNVPNGLPALQPYLTGRQNGNLAVRDNSEACPGFEEWWEIWARVRGTNHHQQAAQAWLSVVRRDLLEACVLCTESYLAHLRDPGVGYNPENFLYDQAKSAFAARWVPVKRAGSDSGVSELARRRWDEEGRL